MNNTLMDSREIGIHVNWSESVSVINSNILNSRYGIYFGYSFPDYGEFTFTNNIFYNNQYDLFSKMTGDTQAKSGYLTFINNLIDENWHSFGKIEAGI